MTKATGATARMLNIDENLKGALTAPVAIRSLGARVAVAVYDGGHLYVAAVDSGEIKTEQNQRLNVMGVNPTSHTPAHNVTAAAAPFRA